MYIPPPLGQEPVFVAAVVAEDYAGGCDVEDCDAAADDEAVVRETGVEWAGGGEWRGFGQRGGAVVSHGDRGVAVDLGIREVVGW